MRNSCEIGIPQRTTKKLMLFRVTYAGKTRHKIKKKLVLQLSFRSPLRNLALRQGNNDKQKARFLTSKTACPEVSKGSE
ncbi:MAG: hypothetical protein DWQ04_10180 [Chloroflexi bacterium]|nr:MAG: hypothetical protein DWQ04_10180 [Chloroflexota bacterium]